MGSKNVLRWSLLESWSNERAWFLGVLYGDGNVYKSPKYSRVSLCGSLSTTTRWIALVAPYKAPQEFKRSPGIYQVYVDSVELVSWFEREMGICGPKSDILVWPKDLPDEFRVSFLRGVWDTDGSLFIEARPKGRGNPAPRAKLAMNARGFVERVRSELELLTGVPPVALGLYKKISELKYGNISAMLVADLLYKNAPEHLRNEDRYEAYLRMCVMRGQLEDATCACGEPVEREGCCTACWYSKREYRTGSGTVCSCGKSPVLAKGLCSACYNRERRTRVRAANFFGPVVVFPPDDVGLSA
jgi:hypothetical protein